MAVRLELFDTEFFDMLERATEKGLKRATVFYHSKCREAVNKANSGVRVKRKQVLFVQNKKGKWTKQRTRTIYPNPSKPGEAPRKRTGFGQSGIIWEKEKARGRFSTRVGVTENAIYMYHLEVGTDHIKARPWLLDTLEEHKETIGRLAVTGK